MTSSPGLSVIVPARDAERGLPGLLGALRAQTLPRAEFEVIVVDDASADRTGEVVRESGFADLVTRASPGGSYAARNDGLTRARGGVLAFSDADCRPDRDWLRCAVSELDATGADLLAGRIEMRLRARPSLVERVDAAHYLDQRSYAARGFGATANLIVRREVFDAVGPFNAQLISNGDRELCLRAGAAGFRLAYADTAVVSHDARRSVRGLVRRAFRMGYGRAQTMVHGSSEATGRTDNWLPLRAYLPTRLGAGSPATADRVRPIETAGDGLLVELAGYVLIGLPLLIGYAAGATRARLPGRGTR